MSQEEMDKLIRGKKASKDELNQIKGRLGWMLEILQALLRKECHPITIAAVEGAIALRSSRVTPSQGQSHVATSHLSVYGPSLDIILTLCLPNRRINILCLFLLKITIVGVRTRLKIRTREQNSLQLDSCII